jgi:hypothetical protein
MFCSLEVVPSIRLAVVRFLSIPEIIITWAIERLLDFFLRHTVRSTKKFLRKHKLYDFYDILLRINQALYFPTVSTYLRNTEYYAEDPAICYAIESFLIAHRSMHKRDLVKVAHSCPTCQYILKYRSSLERCISEPVLYPPYKFVKGEHYTSKSLWGLGEMLQEVFE